MQSIINRLLEKGQLAINLAVSRNDQGPKYTDPKHGACTAIIISNKQESTHYIPVSPPHQSIIVSASRKREFTIESFGNITGCNQATVKSHTLTFAAACRKTLIVD